MRTESPLELRMLAELFTGEEHAPIVWDEGPAAALLIHGFPGTPAECHPLGEALRSAGWTVRAPLLPGFGTDLTTLFDRSCYDWVQAAAICLEALLETHPAVVLIGHSMGGAISAVLAARYAAAGKAPAGLVLVSPFVRLPSEPLWLQLIRRGLRPFVRSICPFRWLDLDDPSVVAGVDELAPTLNLSDPKIREGIRNAPVPLRLFDQLARLGRWARQSLITITVPTMVLQGRHDTLVPPATTRALLSRLGGPLIYREVDGGHDLLLPNRPAWGEVRDAVISFASGLLTAS